MYIHASYSKFPCFLQPSAYVYVHRCVFDYHYLDIHNTNDESFYEEVEGENDEEEGNTAIVSEVSERERC